MAVVAAVLCFQIKIILSIFLSTKHPYTKFQVNRPLVLEEKVQNRFSRSPPSWISSQNDLSFFFFFFFFFNLQQVDPILPTKFRVNWLRDVRGVVF